MLWNKVFHKHVAACCRRSNHKSTCLNLVGNDGISSTLELVHACNPDCVCSRTLNLSTHSVQKVCEVNNVRLFSRIFYNSQPLRTNSGEDCVDGSTDRNDVKVNVCTNQLFSIGVHDTAGCVNNCIQRLKTLDVQVYRTYTKVAAAGHSNHSMIEPSQKRTDKVVGSSHLLNRLNRRSVAVKITAVDNQGVTVVTKLDFRSQLFHNVADNINVFYSRNIFYCTNAFDQ